MAGESKTAMPRGLRNVLEESGDLTVFSGRALAALGGTPRYTSEVLRQAAILVRGSTVFIAVMCAFFGAAASNFFVFLLRSLGAEDFTGTLVGLTNTRLSVIAMFGYAFAAKVGCGLASELGALKVNEEIAAYESEGVDPMRYVVGTRIVGATLFLPIAAFVGLAGVMVGSYVIAVPVLGAVSTSTFFDLYWGSQGLGDQMYTAFGVFLVGIAIILTSCFYGMRVSGGPANVGEGAARSMMVSLVLVHVLLGTLVVAFYGTDLGLPFGG